MISQIPYPKRISFERWAAELIRLYPNERLPIPRDVEKWVDWAEVVVSKGVFKRNNLPAPSTSEGENFEEWQKWAESVYIKMIKSRVE